MFFTVPASVPHDLETPPCIKALTLRITGIEPGGHVMLYSIPFNGMPTRFDPEHEEQRIETVSGHVWTQNMQAGDAWRLELVSSEIDKHAGYEAQKPKPITF
jgi:hypothetical protein